MGAVIVRYEHEWGERKVLVSVMEENKGKHRAHCLCYQQCRFFKPGEPDNCDKAQTLYFFCVMQDMVTPVYECPKYEAVVASPSDTTPVV